MKPPVRERRGPFRDNAAEISRAVPSATMSPSGQLLFGRNAVLEALQAGRPIRRLMVATGAHGGPITQIVDAARERRVNVWTMDRRRMDALAPGVNHQGVVAEAAPFRYASLEDVIEVVRQSDAPGLVLVLDTLQDPQNFGTLLRTAAAVGAHAAIIAEHRAVGVTPVVAKASAGATEHLPVAQVGNLAHALDALKTAGLWVVGLDARAPTPHLEADLRGPLVVVVGAEDRGLRPLVREHCDFLVGLPMPGPIESLNAAVAGSIVLYEVLRQRSTQPAP